MIKKVLAAVFGGILFAIIMPIAYWLIFSSMPLEGFLSGIILLVTCGFIFGGILGALFPKVFGFLFEVLLELFNL